MAVLTFLRWVDLTNNERKKGKGQLHFAASFIPALVVPKPKEEQEKKKEADPADAADATTTTEQEALATPPQEPVSEPPEKDVHGEVIKYTEDKSQINLMAYESGILSVTVHKATLPERQKVTADLLLDSNYPQYRTVQLKGLDLPFNETGDAFVKEMDFSKLTVRIRPVKDNEKDDSHVGYWTSSVSEIVRKLMTRSKEQDEGGETYKLIDCAGGTITLSFKFTPVVKFKLDPRESLESKSSAGGEKDVWLNVITFEPDQGNLTVTVLKANKLPAADRSGTSDPYVVFHVAGVKVYKTEVYKKQLDPVFKDEVFTVPVVSSKKRASLRHNGQLIQNSKTVLALH